ncbi:hypothetical protein BOX15_Mlig016445g1, partial [Macrostomum lignano]
ISMVPNNQKKHERNVKKLMKKIIHSKYQVRTARSNSNCLESASTELEASLFLEACSTDGPNLQSRSNSSEIIDQIDQSSIASSTSIDVWPEASSTSENSIPDDSINQFIKQWVIKFNIPIYSLDVLLPRLQEKYPTLPKCGKTLLKANLPQPIIQAISTGQIAYFGLRCFLNNKDFSFCNQADLVVFVDGFSLAKSSTSSCWAVLGLLGSNETPFVIAIYQGHVKPTASELMSPLINEINELMSDPSQTRLNLKYILADTPARALIKCIKGHTAFYSCDRCVIRGQRVEGRIVFDDFSVVPLRSNQSFRSKIDHHHHSGTSPLLALATFNMISQLPYDFMHLLCLGVVKRMISFWHCGPLGISRLTSRARVAISERLELIRTFMPSEFNRKTRPLAQYKLWKATEFRTFLLYTGICALKNNWIPRQIFRNFCLLFIIARIMCSSSIEGHRKNMVARLIRVYLRSCKQSYSRIFLVYNLHALLHLPDDCELYGCLDSFSAFRFENALGFLRRRVRSGNLPFMQLVNRIREVTQVTTVNLQGSQQKNIEFFEKVSDCLPRNIALQIDFQPIFFAQAKFQGLQLSVKHQRDSYFSFNGVATKLSKIFTRADCSSIYVIARCFKQKEDYFNFPCNSKSLGIFIASKLSDTFVMFELTDPVTKLFAMPLGEDYDEESVLIVPMI